MATNILGSLVADIGVSNVVTSANTTNALVARDGSGNIAVAQVTGNVVGNVTGNLTGNVTGNTSGSSANFTGNLAGDVTGTQGATLVSNVALTALNAGGATTGQVLTYNGTNWAPATSSGGVTGTGVANKVAFWSGTNTLTQNTGFDFHTGGAGTVRLSVGKTPDNTSATTAGRVEANLFSLNDVSTTTNPVTLTASSVASAGYGIIFPPAGPTAAGQSLVTSTTGGSAVLSWTTPSAPAGNTNAVAFYDGSGMLSAGDALLTYDGTTLTAPNFLSSGSLAANSTTQSGNYTVGATDTSLSIIGTHTVTLPTTPTVGRFLTITNQGSGTVTVVTAGGMTFQDGTTTSLNLTAGQAIVLASNDGQNIWNIVGSYGFSAAASNPVTIVPSTGTVTVTEAQSKDYFQSATGVTTTYNLPVLATGNVVYDILNDDATSTTHLAIPTGMTLRVPGAAAIAGPTTYSTSGAFAALKVIGNLSLATYTVLEQTASWTNP